MEALFGAPFGIGMIVSTLVFAAGHAVPMLGAPEPDVIAFLLTGTFAVFAGLLRERTGGIYAPAMLHATIDLNWHLLRLHRVLRVAQFICTGLAFFFIIRWIAMPTSGSDDPKST